MNLPWKPFAMKTNKHKSFTALTIQQNSLQLQQQSHITHNIIFLTCSTSECIYRCKKTLILWAKLINMGLKLSIMLLAQQLQFITILTDQLSLTSSVDCLCCNSIRVDRLTIFLNHVFMHQPYSTIKSIFWTLTIH